MIYNIYLVMYSPKKTAYSIVCNIVELDAALLDYIKLVDIHTSIKFINSYYYNLYLLTEKSFRLFCIFNKGV